MGHIRQSFGETEDSLVPKRPGGHFVGAAILLAPQEVPAGQGLHARCEGLSW